MDFLHLRSLAKEYRSRSSMRTLTFLPLCAVCLLTRFVWCTGETSWAASTLNIAAGEAVTEIEVFEVRLNDPQLDEAVLKQIDKEIPYHILFILTCDGKAQAWIGYKEAAASGSNAFKVSRYYHTDWMPEDELHLRIDGLNMDAVYESLVRQIAGDKLQTDSSESLKESVERDEKKKQLEKQIATLKSKMQREKQLNRQMEMNAKLKKLRIELKQMT